jgi:hypothetical protein
MPLQSSAGVSERCSLRCAWGALRAERVTLAIMESGNGAIRRLVGRVAPQATTRFEDGMVVVSVPLAEWAATSGAAS